MTSLTDIKLRDVVSKWAALFSQNNPEGFAAMYTPNGVYHDHAFQLTRSGQGAIKKHYEIWVHSVPNFTMSIDSFQRSEDGASVRVTGRGTFKNDLPRMKATGGSFEYKAVVDLAVNAAGMIERTDEYYSANFYEGVGFGRYR